MLDSVKYWKDRYKQMGNVYVGDKRHDKETHERFYQHKIEFLQKNIPDYSKVLDFGCGVGMFANLFDKTKYLGIDIIKTDFFESDYNTRLIKPYEKIEDEVDLVFSANVLQHIENPELAISSWNIKKGFIMLMENCKEQNHYTFGRRHIEYIEIISDLFNIKNTRYSYIGSNNVFINIEI